MVRRHKLRNQALWHCSLPQIEGGLDEVGRTAQVAPIVLVGAEGLDFLAFGGEAEIGGDDGEDAFFGEHGEEARGDDVDAGEGKKKWRVTSGEWRVRRKSRFVAALGMTIVGGFRRR